MSPGVRAYPAAPRRRCRGRTGDDGRARRRRSLRRCRCRRRAGSPARRAPGTRKERPTRTAESSPAWTRRYTVILETRIIAATSATVRKVTAARGAGRCGRPTGMAAGCAAGTGRATVAAIGRPIGRGAGHARTAEGGGCWRWGMVMSSSPDLAHVVAPASPPATEHACAATESKGTDVTGAMVESNRRTGPSSAELHLCNTLRLLSRRVSRHGHDPMTAQCWRRVDMWATVPGRRRTGRTRPHAAPCTSGACAPEFHRAGVRGLDRGHERRPHAVPLQLPDRGDRRPARGW